MKGTFKLLFLSALCIAGIKVLKAQNGPLDNSTAYPLALAQESDKYTEGDSKFKLTGYSYLEFELEEGRANFEESAFNPIFLWRNNERLFFEAEVEIEVGSSGYGEWEPGFELEFASMYYKINKYMTAFAGKFLTPIGTFQERLHPAWINKSASKPIGFGKKVNGLKRLQSGSEVGAGLRGGIPLGSAKMNYCLFVSNGAVLDTASGKLLFDNLADNNKNKAIGGRIGILPLSNSSLEIGISEYTAKIGTEGSSYENIGANIFALDFSFVKSFSGIGFIDIKGQYQTQAVDKFAYSWGDVDNTTSAYYVQLAYKLPTMSSSFLNKLELVGRYASLNCPDNVSWGEDQARTTIGINYWLSWNSVLKFAYEIENEIPNNKIEHAFLTTIAMAF